jgi:hypothetical protein
MKILLFPGAFQFLKNYGHYAGVDIWLKETQPRSLPFAGCYIGHSAGSVFTLSNCTLPTSAKFIFVNPLVKKRTYFRPALLGSNISSERGLPGKR